MGETKIRDDGTIFIGDDEDQDTSDNSGDEGARFVIYIAIRYKKKVEEKEIDLFQQKEADTVPPLDLGGITSGESGYDEETPQDTLEHEETVGHKDDYSDLTTYLKQEKPRGEKKVGETTEWWRGS